MPTYPFPVSHGADLTIANVGPWALQNVPKGSETLLNVASVVNGTTGGFANNRVTTFTGYPHPPPWIPSSPYALSNDPSNHGGVLAADTMIDGWLVPAGTWICQYADFSEAGGVAGVIVEGNVNGGSPAWPGIMFRGCRMRGPMTAPGFDNENAVSSNGKTWFNFCDAGGTYCSDQDPGGAPCEVIFQGEGIGLNAGSTSNMYFIRNYLSLAPTFLGGYNDGDAFIENYIENCIVWYDPNGPHGNFYHTNVMTTSGAQTATLWLRNHCSMSTQPACSPYISSPAVIIQMAADNGKYPGTGVNIDGSYGYQMRDNYLGGSSFNISFGVDKSNTLADVSNVTCTGNRFTTFWFELSGLFGVSFKNCKFGVQGNFWQGNTWADDYGTGAWDITDGNTSRQHPAGNGPRTGTLLAAPLGTSGDKPVTLSIVGDAAFSGTMGGTSQAISYTSTAGNSLVLCGYWQSGSATSGFASVTDSAGNTWTYSTTAGTTANPPATNIADFFTIWEGAFVAWTLNAAAVTSVTFTSNLAGGTILRASLSEWSGAMAADTGSAAPITGGEIITPAITPAGASDLMVGCGGTHYGGGVSQPAGSTLFPAAASNLFVYQIPGSAASFQFDWGPSGSNDYPVAMMAFKPAGATPGKARRARPPVAVFVAARAA